MHHIIDPILLKTESCLDANFVVADFLYVNDVTSGFHS